MSKEIERQMESKELADAYKHAWEGYDKEEIKKSLNFYISGGKVFCLVQIPAGGYPYTYVGIGADSDKLLEKW